MSGPPSPVILPVAAASSLTCGSWSWFGPRPAWSALGSGFSSAVMVLLCRRRLKGIEYDDGARKTE